MAELIVLDDLDIARLLTPVDTVAVIGDALARHARGRLAAPPRARAALAPAAGELVVSAGGAAGVGYGFRCYETVVDSPEQLTAVWSATTGRLAGVVVGRLLGEYRTGALGAAAVAAVRGGHCGPLAVIGAGRQAWAQLWALRAVVEPDEIRVFAQHGGAEFARRVTEGLGWHALPTPDARTAVTGADVVVLATNSTVPVIDVDWLDPLAHLSTIGPKTTTGHEADPALYAGRLVFTDSAEQLARYPGGCSFTGTPLELSTLGPVHGLGTAYLSVGLTGTEVLLADRAISLRATGH
jgi:alanine dehydrogenase